ncbi:MAG: cytochrome c-type biogenesis protein [Anaerolineae bacterium]|nr:cytochrome c-type biogenesis protein [Anaerolineae bacterium]
MGKPRRDMALFPLFVLLVAGILFVMPAGAQEPVSDDDVNRVAKDLFCPVCENTPLDTCPTAACQDWRDEIRTQLAVGKTDAEIQQYFVDRYGPRVLSAPPREGFNWLVWLLPVALAIAGIAFFARYLGGLRGKPGAEPADPTFTVTQGSAQAPPPAAGEDDYVSRIEKELRE